MSPTTSAPTTLPSDPVALIARREALGRKQAELEARGAPYDDKLSDGENARNQYFFQEELRQCVKEQLEIMAILRKTAAGPAKAGGKRAKKAPVDLSALEDSIFS